MNSRLKQRTAHWVSPPGSPTGILNLTLPAPSQSFPSLSPDTCSSLPHKFRSHPQILTAHAQSMQSPGGTTSKSIRSRPLRSPRSQLWSQPPSSFTWAPAKSSYGVSVSRFHPLTVCTLHTAARGSFKNVQLGLSLLCCPSHRESKSPSLSRSTRPFQALAITPPPLLSDTSLSHTSSCFRASDLPAPSTSSLGWFLAIQVLAKCFLL